MSIIGNPIMAGASGPAASIFVTGLSETDTVTATKGSKTLTGKWTQKPNPAAHGLPDGYTELEYIEATGSQYVVTNIHPSLTTVVKFGAKFTSKAPNVYIGHMANYSASGWDQSDWRFIQHSSSVRLDMGATQVDSSELNAVVVNNYHDYEMGNFYLKVDGASKISSDSVTSSNGFENYPICIFGTGISSGSPDNSSGELHYVTFYEGETLTANLIPAKRNSDSVIGLYDLVNDVFYTNAGTGTFTAGAEVPQTFDGFQIDKIRDFGTWTVTATDGVRTAIQDVLVDVITEYEIDMNYTLYLYRYGDECEDVTGGWVGTDGGYNATKSGTKNSDSLYCADGSWSNMVLGTNNKVNFTGYTKMYVTRKQVGTNLYQPWVTALIDGKDVGNSNRYPGTGQASAKNVVETAEVDISAISGEHYVIFCNSGSNGAGYLYQLWLE